MCVEPDYSTNRDRPLCEEQDAEATFVRLRAHWLIHRRRKVRFRAHRLIPAWLDALRNPYQTADALPIVNTTSLRDVLAQDRCTLIRECVNQG
jgi:hypothetical protein